MNTLVRTSNTMDPSANAVGIAIFAELTRHPQNSLHLVYQVPHFIRSLVNAASSTNVECRKYACFAFQNLACESGCRQELATTPGLLSALDRCLVQEVQETEQLSALLTMKSISEDPSNFIHLSNTHGCIQTLIRLANKDDNSRAQYEAADILATLSHWMIASATAAMKFQEDEVLHVPVIRVEGWNQFQ
mmetsp:Transcript_18158/g.22569  ORF Transcript_18158/g.22569 Transcript_18158/m.22569 type:complete len:190 (+) Transcript_18158:100-669(+)